MSYFQLFHEYTWAIASFFVDYWCPSYRLLDNKLPKLSAIKQQFVILSYTSVCLAGQILVELFHVVVLRCWLGLLSLQSSTGFDVQGGLLT